MTSKERVQAALKREPTDRVPIFMWFHPEMATRLAELLEIPLALLGEAMGDDVRQTWVGNNYAMEGIVHDREGETHVDDWGIEWIRIGSFNQIKYSPLQQADESEIVNYQFPYHRVNDLLSQMEAVVPYAEDYFIGCDISPCLFEMLSRLRGMENAALDLVSDSKAAITFLNRTAEFAIRLGELACQRFDMDWFWTGDDVAGQKSMIMSPTCWREKIKPHLKRIFEVGRKQNLWIAYHSCGALRPIIPDLIDIGMDVLNPVQCNCPGMDPFMLKEEFGRDIAFMGGVDTQHLLSYGTPQQVRRATEKLLHKMCDDGGGYILAASHTVPPETPLTNVFMMYEVAGISREEIFDRASTIRKRVPTTLSNQS